MYMIGDIFIVVYARLYERGKKFQVKMFERMIRKLLLLF